MMPRPATSQRRASEAPSTTIRHLRELIAALDWRLPQVERAGEIAIARDAAALKTEAMRRIAELEREMAEGEQPGAAL